MFGVSLWFVVKKTFWDFYDNLGSLLVANLVFLGLSLLVVPFPFLLIGMFVFTRAAALKKESSIKDMLTVHKFLGIKRFLAVGFFVIVFLLFPFANLVFTNAVSASSAAVVFKGMSFFVLLFVSLVSLYFFPLLAAGNGIRKSIAYSLFFIRANLLYSLLNALVLFLLAGFLMISGVGIILFVFSLISLYSNNMFIYAFDMYRKETTLDYKFYRGRSLKEIFLFWRY